MGRQPNQRSWTSWLDRSAGRRARRATLLRLRDTALAGLAAAALLTAAWPSTSQAATPKATLRSRLLSVADLPAGWSVGPVSQQSLGQLKTSTCGAAIVAVLHPPGLSKSTIGPLYATATFVEGTVLPELRETLTSGDQAQETWRRLNAVLARCRTANFSYKGTKVRGTGKHLGLVRLGHRSSAYAWQIEVVGAKASSYVDLILFETASYYGYLSYLDVAFPQVSALIAFARAAVAKASKGSTAPVSGSVSIASTPVRTAHTTLGTVGYRSIGHGPALVMIAGYDATMEDWGPLLVNDLAQRYRVIIFDNAGVGRTRSLPGPLSIDAMANQTAAFIDALHLGRPDVLGWSMGTAVAQALAVLHPNEVRRLVLCAPYPGNGAVVLPSTSVLDAKNDPTALFPSNQIGAEAVYDISLSTYPKAPLVPKVTAAAQLKALRSWWAGADSAGQLVAKITAPTLLADGSADRLDPVVNSHVLTRLIRGAKLVLYPDAGHAFLFQDYPAFAVRVESFLGRGKSA